MIGTSLKVGFLVIAVVMAMTFVFGRVLMMRAETRAVAGEPLGPDAAFIRIPLGRVHYLDRGEGPVILLLHGSGRSIADWQEGLAERLSRSHRVIAIDYFGNGLSDRNHGLSYGYDLWVEEAVEVLDALGVARVTVVGHSVGGVIATLFSLHHPDRAERLVTIGTGTAIDPMQVLPLVPGLGEVILGRSVVYSETFSSTHAARLAQAWRISGTRAAFLTYLRRQYTIDGVQLLTGVYDRVSLPALHIHGTRDASIPVAAGRAMAAKTGGRFVEVEGAGHNVHIDAPDALAHEISRFISENPAGR